jgi:hypothetical protein
MGRTKTVGIYRSSTGYNVDKQYRNTRLRRCGFEDFKQAESWLIEQMALARLTRFDVTHEARTFAHAATYYLERFKDKPSLVSDAYHLKAVMPSIGSLALCTIHNGTLAAFVAQRRAEGRKNKTINLSLGIVRRILNLAARDWRDDNGVAWLAR